MMKINPLRTLAQLSHSTYYFDNKPCIYGHLPPLKRFTHSSGCYQCSLVSNEKRRKDKQAALKAKEPV